MKIAAPGKTRVSVRCKSRGSSKDKKKSLTRRNTTVTTSSRAALEYNASHNVVERLVELLVESGMNALSAPQPAQELHCAVTSTVFECHSGSGDCFLLLQ